MQIEKFTIGVGDRFGKQGPAQLSALKKALDAGVEIIPVWNKSNREHTIIGTTPSHTRAAADSAVKTFGWNKNYHLDADHIALATVDRFLPYCDFFTIDVADFIGKPPTTDDADTVRQALRQYVGTTISELGLQSPLRQEMLEKFIADYASAICQAGRIHKHIENAKGRGNFIAEVSTDEAEIPQSPLELFLILGGLAACGVRVQTIAPKFSGRFNKGVDYVGNLHLFTKEFEQDLLAVKTAIKTFSLPPSLKLSVHSGSDKFSLYNPIHTLIKKHNCGIHLKTAGTTWLEELIGLALSEGEHLALAKTIYKQATAKISELTAPYATVIDIDIRQLPDTNTVENWSGSEFARALAHEPQNPLFNPHFRQLLHVSFKIAAQMGEKYLSALDSAAPTISQCVTDNLWRRHIRPLFLGP
jgi:hypothetical protein